MIGVNAMENERNVTESMNFFQAFVSGIDFSHIILWTVIVALVFAIGNLLWISYKNFLIARTSQTGVLLEVLLEKETDTDPFAIEQFWTSFHGLRIPWYMRLFKPEPYISFEIKSENSLADNKKEITFNFWVTEEYLSWAKNRILGLYPSAQINILENDYIPDLNDRNRVIETAEIGLKEDSAFSIKTFENFDSDPLSSITSALTNLDNKEIAVVQVVARPHNLNWRNKASRILERYERTGKKPNKLPEWTNYLSKFLIFFYKIIDWLLAGIFMVTNPDPDVRGSKGTSKDSQRQKEMLEKVNRPPFSFQIRIMVGTPYGKDEAKEKIRNIIASFNELDGPNNRFKKEMILKKNRTYIRMKNRFFGYSNRDDVLSSFELAGFAHLPNKNNFTPNLKKVQSKRTEFSSEMTESNHFAHAMDTHGQKRPVGLDLNGRMRHVYVSGMTGVGKSTLLENMIVTDIENGKGVVVVDPHGELVDEVLDKISTDREDIFVLDPADIAYPFGMNLLELSSTDPLRREMEKVLVVDAYITAMKRVFGEGSIGANTDDIFRMSCSAILDHPEGGGLLEMLLMLVNEKYRARVCEFIKDPIVKNYWTEVFPALAGKGQFLVQNLNAPLNKIRRFIANGLVSNIICQKKSTLNVADAINSGAVILARFSRGDMGFENSALLGTMLISKIQIAAMQRVNIPKDQRVPTYLYVDEFQNFVGDEGGAKSFAEILSEARKYRLGLIIAHQFVEQLKQASGNFLLEAIFNNCGTTITFRVGASDARFFEKMYYDENTGKGFKSSDIANLGLGEVVMRVMTKKGIQSQPFIAQTLMPLKPSPYANPELIRKRSRERISVSRDHVRQSIENRMAMDTLVDAKT